MFVQKGFKLFGTSQLLLISHPMVMIWNRVKDYPNQWSELTVDFKCTIESAILVCLVSSKYLLVIDCLTFDTHLQMQY